MNLLLPRQHCALLVSFILVLFSSSSMVSNVVDGFVTPLQDKYVLSVTPATVGMSRSRLSVASDIQRPPTFLDDDDEDDEEDGFDDDDDDDDFAVRFLDETSTDDESSSETPTKRGYQRWLALNPKIKKRLIEQGQAKAIANKKKREPAADKKRRLMMHFKKLQSDKKRSARVQRPLGFHERTPLAAMLPGMEITGTVISLTKFGAYVDVGTECDGLLHISQITRDFFVEHPRQVFSPGDDVTVTVLSTNPKLKKMHLSMLPKETLELEQQRKREDETDTEERIALQELQTDDELWGELKRVTDFGAYVEVGAEVDGFLHFMDHPSWDNGNHPSSFMSRGDRVRVWVSDVDLELNRLKLTAVRPSHLPGPRREL